MKIQQTRRRKLRFKSVKDSAPVVTVRVEHVQQRPAKHRRRRNRSYRHSPVLLRQANSSQHSADATRRESGLPTATWNMIRDLLVSAKSLGEIARITLQFFKEHEDLQRVAAFPIFIAASEVYKMMVPRKRRIYDVLHVLEGIGVIKRIRCDEARKVKGGYFLYYGKAAAIQRLAELKSESSQLMVNFHRSHTSKKPSIIEEDSALVKVFEDKAAMENWPCLATTTACFLGLLFLEDYQATVALPVISRRFIEAKRFTGALVPSWTENAHADVHRRVYDVVSVLVSCNLVLTSGTSDTSLESCSEPMDKMSQRKHVRFNYDIFTNPGLLLATNVSATQWDGNISHEATLDTSRVCTFSSPTIWRVPEDSLGVHPSLHATNASPEFASVGVHFVDHEKSGGIRMTSVQFATGSVGTNNSYPEAPTRSYSEAQPACRIQDLFSPLGKETSGMNEWCDESVKQLAFQDALPSADRIDWELTQEFKESYRAVWGALSPPIVAPADINAVEGSPDLVDLECQEVLADETTITESFLL